MSTSICTCLHSNKYILCIILKYILYCSLSLTSNVFDGFFQICGKQTCRAFDDCISCIFTIEEEAVVQHDYEDCMSLCNNMTIHVSSRASTINSGNDTLECKSTISSQTCSGLSFFVRTTDNVIYVASTPSSECYCRMFSYQSQYLTCNN